ncbi:MmyB family transcriptional regulator [Flavisphingomonas formosensis]|uniref:MmyB family transcriptional regulator n=1 Tax=Flavisphingomonas formosensis TaxID=861534 RepID=UPI0012FCD8B4|nr:helix-turn-helix domain-containing protein [Sphingomonas formosensis]
MQTDEQRMLLGAFVRARREGLRPEEPGRRRRTPGLRREELADRAGISVTWLSWIEQGRTVRASSEALARLAAALRLTRAERLYLFELAGRHDPDNPFAGGGSDAPASIRVLVEALPHPAYGLDPAWNICCWNAAAARLLVGLLDRAEGHRNLLRYVFTDAAARQLLPDWEARASRILAEFRTDYGRNLADPRARAIVTWLTGESEPFRRAWDAQSVAEREGGRRRFDHPEDGRLCFRQHTLLAADRPDFKLVALEPMARQPD